MQTPNDRLRHQRIWIHPPNTMAYSYVFGAAGRLPRHDQGHTAAAIAPSEVYGAGDELTA